MSSKNIRTQVIHLELKSFWREVSKLGICSSRPAAENRLYRALKLCRVPGSLKESLEKISVESGLEIYLPPLDSGSPEDFNAVLIGTGQGFKILSLNLKKKPAPADELGAQLEISLSTLHQIRKPGLRLGEKLLPLGERTLIMGILNITPDSFSDGGRFNQVEKAVEQAFLMADEGADIIDIGGESTRPGHEHISQEEELKRVLPVITALKKERSLRTPLSIDTYKAAVAEEAVAAGVEMINDVWGLKEDLEVGKIAARHAVPICLMHNRRSTEYEDLIPDILLELKESVKLAHLAGVEDDHIILDPGIGFGKNLEQNLEVMLHLQDFCSLNYPLLLGTSRKSMIGKTLDLPADERLEGTAATVSFGISAGVDIIRIHDVKQMRRVALMTDAIIRR